VAPADLPRRGERRPADPRARGSLRGVRWGASLIRAGPRGSRPDQVSMVRRCCRPTSHPGGSPPRTHSRRPFRSRPRALRIPATPGLARRVPIRKNRSADRNPPAIMTSCREVFAVIRGVFVQRAARSFLLSECAARRRAGTTLRPPPTSAPHCTPSARRPTTVCGSSNWSPARRPGIITCCSAAWPGPARCGSSTRHRPHGGSALQCPSRTGPGWRPRAPTCRRLLSWRGRVTRCGGSCSAMFWPTRSGITCCSTSGVCAGNGGAHT